MAESNAGRPTLTQPELDLILSKIEPYIKKGLSLYKSCCLAEVPYSTVRDYYVKGEEFSLIIDAWKAYKTNIVSDLFQYRLEKSKEVLKDVLKLREELRTAEDLGTRKKIIKDMEELEQYIDWQTIYTLIEKDKSFRDEFGLRQEVTGKDGDPVTLILDTIENSNKKTNYGEMGQEARQQMVENKQPLQNKE
jgi:hypothetical protein